MTASGDDLTRVLSRVAAGRAGPEELLPLVYDELRSLAADRLRREGPGHTLQPTALVHEAYLRLVDQTRAQWRDETHFFAVAATAIRRVLIDHARRRSAEKRGGSWERIGLTTAAGDAGARPVDLVELDDALRRLAELDERKSRVVELRYFGGLDIERTAEILGVSPATVERDWALARAWLYRELTGEPGGG